MNESGGRPRELRTRCNMRSIYGQSCKHASECYAGIAARVLRVTHVVEMKESRPSTRPPTRLSQAVRDHGGAGQLDPRTVIRSNTNTVPYFRGAVAVETPVLSYLVTKIVSSLRTLWLIFRVSTQPP